MADKVGQQIGNYRLVRLLGSGGFADVYLGQHVLLASKQAAIKVLHLFDIDAKKFQEEAETTEKLVHPHIVRLLDFALQEGTPFLVLDYAPGGSLRSRHPKGSQLPLDTVIGYLKEITPALQYAHGLNTLHRDIKPDNILIGRQGELLLSDFGMAVLSQTGRTSMQNYNVGGTPFYMAPEQYKGKPEKASDQYALGIVVYEWLCGVVPFREGNFIQLGYQHTHEPVPPLREKIPSIPSEVEAVVMKALAKDPIQRFDSVQTFAHALEQAFKEKLEQARRVEEERIQRDREEMRARRIVEERARQDLLEQEHQAELERVRSETEMRVRQEEQARRRGKKIKKIVWIGIVPLVIVILVLSFGTVGTLYIRQPVLLNATVIAANPNPYGGGTLTIYDPLRDNSGYNWDTGDNASNCKFLGNAYHVISSAGVFVACSETIDFSNFAFEVQMKITKGDCGGIIFRGDSGFTKGYHFGVCQDGSYYLALYSDNTSQDKILTNRISSAIHTGLKVSNVIAVVASGSKLDLYVNMLKIASVTDNTYGSGIIGLTAYSSQNNPSEVAYNNARAWKF